MNTDTTTDKTAKYPGSVRSALARVRRTLDRAGIKRGKVVGRYSPFGGTQRIVEGWNVSRVGCSKWIALHWYSPRQGRPTDEDHVIATMRAAGLPFDDRGWLLCAYAD